jgi:dipeptidyl aminopeptidase/acylaminoacyl peptidase
MTVRLRCSLILFFASIFATSTVLAQQKPALTFDEFFNSVFFDSVQISPDGHSVVIAVERADWEQSIFRRDLYLYRDGMKGEGALTQLTQFGHDGDPQWSPDGRWIAFLSERKVSAGKSKGAAKDGKDGKDDDPDSKDKEVTQIYLISPNGGEAFPATQGEEDVHSFAWSADSRTLFYATRIPWTKAQKDAYKRDWKDVIEYRNAERGDEIFSLTLADVFQTREAKGVQPVSDADDAAPVTPGIKTLARSDFRIDQIATSPDGKRLAFNTTSISEREELISEFEIYAVDLAEASPDRAPRRLTHNEAQEGKISWASDNRHVLFHVSVGSVEGKYVDTQERLYWVDADTGETARWAAGFDGGVSGYNRLSDNSALFAGVLGTEVGLYSQANPAAKEVRLPGWPGTYGPVSNGTTSSRLAFVYSALDRPAEVYLAENSGQLQQARPITSFNKLFTERELPKGKPYRWKSSDGTPVEGMLIYPPGKFEAKGLPMLTLIHGGPADADGNHFEADWYQWSAIAATNGWLVFQPNYRGSTGYGDKFLMQIVPEIVSRPGKDILTGVDALVKDGIADSDHLAISGYSYGGYMTNWLITQTTRFKAAMTGAGAVEHAANWGNDDTTFDDAYFLGGRPWEAAQRYHDEAALFQMDKVKTPTHLVAGSDDIRVAVSEDYLLDHVLHSLGISSNLLIFPGEGHSLTKNPWHGKIKVREEMKWLEKYAGKPGVTSAGK